MSEKKVPKNLKVCPRCGKTKKRDGGFQHRADGSIFSWCKACNRDYARERAAAKKRAKEVGE